MTQYSMWRLVGCVKFALSVWFHKENKKQLLISPVCQHVMCCMSTRAGWDAADLGVCPTA